MMIYLYIFFSIYWRDFHYFLYVTLVLMMLYMIIYVYELVASILRTPEKINLSWITPWLQPIRYTWVQSFIFDVISPLRYYQRSFSNCRNMKRGLQKNKLGTLPLLLDCYLRPAEHLCWCNLTKQTWRIS
jgi:hypothetical protein